MSNPLSRDGARYRRTCLSTGSEGRTGVALLSRFFLFKAASRRAECKESGSPYRGESFQKILAEQTIAHIAEQLIRCRTRRALNDSPVGVILNTGTTSSIVPAGVSIMMPSPCWCHRKLRCDACGWGTPGSLARSYTTRRKARHRRRFARSYARQL